MTDTSTLDHLDGPGEQADLEIERLARERQRENCRKAAYMAGRKHHAKAEQRRLDDARLRASADTAETVIERHIRELVEAAPPLRPEQIDRLAVLLRGGGGKRR